MSISETIITGTVSGVLAAVVIHFLILVFKKCVLTWYRRMIYRGIDVSGEWINDSLLPTGTQESNVLIITQVVDKLDAIFTISQKKKDESTTSIKTYKMDGELRERFMMLSGSNVDPKSIGVCSLLLQVVGSGDEMEGIDAFYNVTTKTIMGNQVTWRRTKVQKNADEE